MTQAFHLADTQGDIGMLQGLIGLGKHLAHILLQFGRLVNQQHHFAD